MDITHYARGFERVDQVGLQRWCIFPGMGKSFVQRTCNGFDSKYYYLELPTDNYVKDRFPTNYIQAVKDLQQVFTPRSSGASGILMLTSHESVRAGLGENDMPFALFYPDISLKEEYIQRYKDRGSSPAFIEHVSQHWGEWIRGCENDPYASVKIRMESGEYLFDFLRKADMV